MSNVIPLFRVPSRDPERELAALNKHLAALLCRHMDSHHAPHLRQQYRKRFDALPAISTELERRTRR